jgi:hypothetical protein
VPAASTWKFATRWPRSARNSSWTSWRSKSRAPGASSAARLGARVLGAGRG